VKSDYFRAIFGEIGHSFLCCPRNGKRVRVRHCGIPLPIWVPSHCERQTLSVCAMGRRRIKSRKPGYRPREQLRSFRVGWMLGCRRRLDPISDSLFMQCTVGAHGKGTTNEVVAIGRHCLGRHEPRYTLGL
jgi:hypothetical protein